MCCLSQQQQLAAGRRQRAAPATRRHAVAPCVRAGARCRAAAAAPVAPPQPQPSPADWLPGALLRLQGGPRAGAASGPPSSAAPDFFGGKLPGKLLSLAALLLLSRVGVYIPLEGVDRAAFAQTVSASGLLGYVDTLAGGSISKVGVFSLGIVPFINSSIVFQACLRCLWWRPRSLSLAHPL